MRKYVLVAVGGLLAGLVLGFAVAPRTPSLGGTVYNRQLELSEGFTVDDTERMDTNGNVTFVAGTYTGVLESEVSVSSVQFHSGGATIFELGKTGETVSSVPIRINGVVGEDITASSNPATATSTIVGIGCIQFVNRNTGYHQYLSATTAGAVVMWQDGDCPW